jgi:hypothetical protein
MGLNLDTRGGQLAMRDVILPGRKVHIVTQVLLLYWQTSTISDAACCARIYCANCGGSMRLACMPTFAVC